MVVVNNVFDPAYNSYTIYPFENPPRVIKYNREESKMISYEYIEDAIMGAAQEVIDYAKTTYDKLYTWQPVNTILKYNGLVWEEVAAPGNSAWRYYGNPNDKPVFDPGKKKVVSSLLPEPSIGDIWIEAK